MDIHVAGADHSHVVIKRNSSIVRHEHVRILRGIILFNPETTQKERKKKKEKETTTLLGISQVFT